MTKQEIAKAVQEVRQRLDEIRAAEAQAKTTRRDESKPDNKDLLRQLCNSMSLPVDIALGFLGAIEKAQPENLPKIERMLRERGREWTGQKKRAPGPLNKVTKRRASA